MSSSVNENAPFVAMDHFTKVYGSGKNAYTACADVTLSFKAGSVTCLLGPNGAGKTTLLKALCGIHYPTSGSVRICSDVDSDPLYVRQNTGYVPETPDLDPRLTVKETLYLSAELHGLSGSQAQETVSNAVAYAELGEVLGKNVSTLSKGFMQRTSFAKALAYNPPVLVLDEFSDGLDPAQIVRMRDVITKIAQEKAVLLSTHHIEEAVLLSKNVYIIAHGKIVSSGSLQQVIDSAKKKTLEEAFLALTAEK